MLIIHCRLKESGLENIVTMRVHPRFIIIFPIVIKPPFVALQMRNMRQDGLSDSNVPGYSSPQAVLLNKINIDKNLTNTNLGVLKLSDS